jgi:hypothetical protein
LQAKHNISTLSTKIKLIDTRCETGEKSWPKINSDKTNQRYSKYINNASSYNIILAIVRHKRVGLSLLSLVACTAF